jgi:transposase
VTSPWQLHGVDRSGTIVLRKALRRSQMQGFFSTLSPRRIGMEACATAHHRARTLMAFGHDVRLIPLACVKPLSAPTEERRCGRGSHL